MPCTGEATDPTLVPPSCSIRHDRQRSRDLDAMLEVIDELLRIVPRQSVDIGRQTGERACRWVRRQSAISAERVR